MILEIQDNKGRKIGSMHLYEFDSDVNDINIVKVDGNIMTDVEFDNIYDTNEQKVKIQIEKESTFESLNHESCVIPLKQELGAYEALKKSFLNKRYHDCYTLIHYYFGHINYATEFGYNKTHGEICCILFSNLLYSIETGNDNFINFVDRMIGKIKWNLDNQDFLNKNVY